MKKLLLFSALIALIALSCSKEQKTVNKLEGSWKASTAKLEIFGVALEVPVEDLNIVYTFYECKVKDGACSGLADWDGILDEFDYTIGGEGTTIESVDSSGQIQVLNIIELEKESFKIDMDLGLDTLGSKSTVTFKRKS